MLTESAAARRDGARGGGKRCARATPRPHAAIASHASPVCPAWQRERVASSLAFDTGLGQRAADSGQLKGTIFQALLAYSDGSHGATASSVGLELSEEEWQAEAQGADALRKLVRIKVQDDNDLKAAHGALTSCSDFFANLRVYASRTGTKPPAVISRLEESFS